MHYVFVDESYPHNPGRTTVVIASWLVEQSRFSSYLSKSPDLHRTPVLETIDSMLESVDGWAIVGRADLDPQVSRAGEIDGTDDVSSMSRRDNVWSQCFIFAIGKLIAHAASQGRQFEAVDIHYDPRSLKSEHQSAIEDTLRQLVISEAKRYDSQLARLKGRVRSSNKLKIRRIQPVPKLGHATVLDKFQRGTWVADKLCSNAEVIRTHSFSRIIAVDMSEVVRRTVQQFDGKPYYK